MSAVVTEPHHSGTAEAVLAEADALINGDDDGDGQLETAFSEIPPPSPPRGAIAPPDANSKPPIAQNKPQENARVKPSHVSDWMLEATISAIVIVLVMTIWLYVRYANNHPMQEKAQPVWLGVTKVTSQMSDDRMVDIKVKLRLDNEKALDQMEPHAPAFEALIQEAGAKMTREDLQQRGGLKRLASGILNNINDYLEEQALPGRIKEVDFEEVLLMPT